MQLAVTSARSQACFSFSFPSSSSFGPESKPIYIENPGAERKSKRSRDPCLSGTPWGGASRTAWPVAAQVKRAADPTGSPSKPPSMESCAQPKTASPAVIPQTGSAANPPLCEKFRHSSRSFRHTFQFRYINITQTKMSSKKSGKRQVFSEFCSDFATD